MSIPRTLTAPALMAGVAALFLVLAACSRESAPTGALAAGPSPATATLVVHEGPYCGCCGLWREHMQAAGFDVEVQKTQELGRVKMAAGVPRQLASCHTAKVGGYYIEGHVPAEEVKRLLEERPNAWGLAVTGMPAGSPGMEMPDGRVDPYDVLLVRLDGSTEVFASYPKPAGSCCSIDLGEEDAS
jgi:hypothetical protein